MLIKPPEKGTQKSTTKNNTAPDAIADWIEASVLFGGEVVSDGEISDILYEQNIAADNDKDDLAVASIADVIIVDARTEIKSRLRRVPPMTAGGGGYILTAKRRFAPVVETWEHDSVRAFFLILSLFRRYPDWFKSLQEAEIHTEFSTQGALFEEVSETLLKRILPKWRVERVGWSPDHAEGIIPIVENVCRMLNSPGHANIERWAAKSNKDGGLDIVAVRDFEDMRQGLPTYLIQCASGANWRSKISTPAVSSWHKWLDTAVEPSAGLTAPFVINDALLEQEQLRGQSIVLDRLRLLSGSYGGREALDPDLLQRIQDWCGPFVEALPWMTEFAE